MKQYKEAFMAYLSKHPTDLAEAEMESILDVLFRCYQESRRSDSEDIRHCFNELDDILSKLPLEENDRVFLLICDLFDKYRKEAFQSGILIGFHLLRELST